MVPHQPFFLDPGTQSVLSDLVHLSASLDSTDSQRVLQKITELAAVGIQVARASVWLRDEMRDGIVAQDIFDQRTGKHTADVFHGRREYPTYFSALDQSLVIVANDAHTHPATSCFSTSYLAPVGIGAMLDAPIWRGGQSVGVLCLEHVTGERQWQDHEKAYATHIALICGLYYERLERLRAEQELHHRDMVERQLQKMHTIGRMACSIGHDFNNFLTAIIGQTQLLQAQLLQHHTDALDNYRQRADAILDAATRAGALVQRLLNFGKMHEISDVDLDLVMVIRSLHNLLRSSIPKNIDLLFKLPEKAIFIRGDPVLLEQVIINLVINARDAITDSGSITLGIMHGIEDATKPSVKLIVNDTGCGMDEATLNRACEPFFTTKGEQGVGLGLSTCFNNMRRMNGFLSITSAPGLGTTCTCTFPLLTGIK
jgi:signal transduction histidine kinase